jgi:hypothetical protein
MMIDKSSKLGLFLSHVVPSVLKPLHSLWNEIIGFIFICLCLGALPSVYRDLRALDEGKGELGHLLVSAGFALIMAYFGITSFLRARKISRSS